MATLLTMLLLAAVALAGKPVNDRRFCLSHPLSKSTFRNWKASSSAVFLENKTILTPELPERYGMIFAKNAFTLTDYGLEVDLKITNIRARRSPEARLTFTC